MNTSNQSKPSEEEVLLAFAVEPHHDRETLTRYVKDYPEYSTSLANLSIELMIEETREEKEALPSTSAANKAWQQFRSTVDIANSEPVTDPFSGLNAAQLKAVADKIGINKLLLIRLRDRGIDISTIPGRLIEKAAVALNVKVDSLKSYLSGSPCMASALSFRSDVKPVATEQISFVEAVESSQLSLQQQAEMKALMED